MSVILDRSSQDCTEYAYSGEKMKGHETTLGRIPTTVTAVLVHGSLTQEKRIFVADAHLDRCASSVVDIFHNVICDEWSIMERAGIAVRRALPTRLSPHRNL